MYLRLFAPIVIMNSTFKNPNFFEKKYHMMKIGCFILAYVMLLIRIISMKPFLSFVSYIII